MSELSIIQFPATGVDITGSLRRVADQIEAGKHGEVRFAGLVLCVGGKDVAVFSFGNLNTLETCGIFAVASTVAGRCSDLVEPDPDEPAETA